MRARRWRARWPGHGDRRVDRAVDGLAVFLGGTRDLRRLRLVGVDGGMRRGGASGPERATERSAGKRRDGEAAFHGAPSGSFSAVRFETYQAALSPATTIAAITCEVGREV